jgi:transcriptional regulator with XRE-family HTH domain
VDKPEKLDISYMGPIFKKYRIEAKRTQEEVAERVGITDRFLMALENEEKRPSIDNLLRLVDALNIPGDAILHPQLQHIDSEDQQLLRQFMRLSDRDKAVIRAAIQEMLNNR